MIMAWHGGAIAVVTAESWLIGPADARRWATAPHKAWYCRALRR
jgi:hypothetical protein